MNSISEKKILITGAAGDIGKHIAFELAKNVNNTVVGLDKKMLELESGSVIFHQCDLTNFSETEKLINELASKYGAFDVVINCAGIIANAPIVSFTGGSLACHDPDLWNKIITTNLYTTFNVTAVNVKHMMVLRKKGVIINISSICANGNPGQVAYSSAKAGINGFTKALSKELGVFGIRVVSIAPGFFETSTTKDNVPQARLNTLTSNIPLKRLGRLDEIMKTINYIIDTGYINGKVIELDGGLVI